jgi:hypothetical protein
MPTRITAHSATLIDNIFTNHLTQNLFSGIIINDLSDHLPVFVYVFTETPPPCKSAEKIILKLRIHGQYFSGDGNAMVVKSLQCRREKEIACVSCSATATQSCAQSLPKFQII